MQLLDAFNSLAQREAIKRAVEKKSAEVFTSLTQELSLVKKGFDKQKAAPPLIHRDHPRYAGAALWAKSLHLRITRQWSLLEASSKTSEDLSAKTAEARQAHEQYTLLDASLRHFDSVVGTYDRLVVYQSAYREDVDAAAPAAPPAAAAAAPRGRAGSFDEEAAPPAPPAPAPVVAASSSSRRAFYLSLLTARQLELYLERRILSVSADVGTSTLEETERELAFLEALEPVSYTHLTLPTKA